MEQVCHRLLEQVSIHQNLSPLKNLLTHVMLFAFLYIAFPKLGEASTPKVVIENWSKDKSYTATTSALADTASAYVIFDRKYITFDKYIREGKARQSSTQTIHRRIKILSSTALDNFNKVYVPSTGTLFIKNDILDIRGRTIKSDGTIIEIDTSDVRETTLPANVPFYSSVQGKVKLFALPNVGIGDEIEYYFTVTIDYSDPRTDFQQFGSFDLDVPYPTKEKSLTINYNKEFFLKSFSVNTDVEMKSSTAENAKFKSYHANATNLTPFKSERLALNYLDEKQILYHIYKFDRNAVDASWEDATDASLKKDRYTYYTYAGKSLTEVQKVVKGKKDLKSQVQYLLDNGFDYDSYETLYDAVQPRRDGGISFVIYNELAKSMNAKVNFWFVINRKDGVIKENIPTLSQFSDVIVEYYNAAGESYFLPTSPLNKLDETLYDYHNTRALKVSIDDKNKINHEFVNFEIKPIIKSSNITRTYDIDIDLKNLANVKVNENATFTGFLMNRYKYPIFASNKYTKYTSYKDNRKESLEDKFDDCKVLDFTLSKFNPSKDTSLGWNLTFEYPVVLDEATLWSFSLSDLTGYNAGFYLHCEKRTKDGYLSYPYGLTHKYRIKVANGSILPNDRLNTNLENEYGFLKSSVKAISPTEIEVELSYGITKDFCPAKDWCKYMLLENSYDNVLKQSLVVTR